MKRLASLLILTAGAAIAFPNPDGTCSITTAAVLPQAVQGGTISYPIATTGCATPLRDFVRATGQLPPGLTLKTTASGATLSGKPTSAGVYAFALRAIDTAYKIPSKSFVLQVNGPVQIDTPAAATGTTGASYTDTIRARGGVAPYTFSVVEGALPTGLNLAAATGIISGTMPAAGTRFRIRVTDSSSPANIAERPYTIVPSGQITTLTTPPVGVTGAPYSFDIDGSLGASGLALVIGPLPAGLSVDTNGLISGTPSEAGEFHVTVRQTVGTTSAWRSYRILVRGTGTVSGTPRDAEETFAYEHVFNASGSVGPYTYSVTSGALPTGITLDGGTGALLGELPLGVAGTSFTISATDATGAISLPQPFSITRVLRLQGAAVSPPATHVSQFSSNVPMYSLTQGGSGKAFTRIGGHEVSLDGSTGAVTYFFQTAGAFTPVVLGTDALGGGVVLNTGSITIVGDLSISTVSELPNATAGGSYNASVSVLNGIFTPLTFSLAGGTLPPLLTLNASTGVISGLVDPMQGGNSYPFTVSVTDSTGQTASRDFFIGVGEVFRITTTTVPVGTTGSPYNGTGFQFNYSGPIESTWSLAGESLLPPGLSLSPAGLLSGTPTLAGTYTFSIRASPPPEGISDTKSFTIYVSDPLSASIAPPTSSQTAVGSSVSALVTPVGGRAPMTMSLSTGSLPEGLYLNNGSSTSSLYIAGVPMQAGTSNFTILLTDADGRTVTIPYSILVRTRPVITNTVLPPGTRNAAYNHALAGEGGLGPYNFSLYGLLPAGMTLSPAGVISGTPTENVTVTTTIIMSDSAGSGTSVNLTLTVTDAVVITNAVPLPNGLALSAYSTPITTTGGEATKTFSISAGDLPPLITINPNTGVISNLPLVPGAYTFTVRAEDSAGRVGTLAEQLQVLGPLTLAPASLPNATAGAAYNQPLTATGASGAVTWAVIAGALPAGLSLGVSTGVISGTPTTPGPSSFTIQATDSLAQVGSRDYAITVLAVLSISPATLPNATAGTAYNQALTATGASGAVTWAVIAGTLPAGLSLGVSTGVISGTPTTSGPSSFTIQATDSLTQVGSRDYAITVLAILSISPATLPNGTAGSVYSQALTATNATGTVNWTLASGTLPAGLTLGASTGVISGTPTTPGSSSFTIQATDSLTQTGSRAYSISVLNVLGISPATLPNGTVGTNYSQTVTATNATGAVTWTLASGTLPAGLTLGASTGTISGTPTAPGSSSFTVQATDSLTQTGSRAYSITVLNVLGISPATLPNGTDGAFYSQTLTATNATGSVAWTLASGTLPAGLTLGASSGIISGTPTTPGTSSFTIQATDSLTQTGSHAYSLTILNILGITPSTLPSGTIGTAYSQALTATGETGAVTWTVAAGALPPGLTLGASTGVIGGTPTTFGTFEFTVQATDSLTQTGTRSYSITVSSILNIMPATVANGTFGVAYTQTLTVTNGTGAISWLVTAGALPTGLSLGTGTGVISGTPSAAGTFSFTIQATDSLAQTGTRAYTPTIAGVLTIAPATVPNGSVGVTYSQTLTATGGTGTPAWSINAGTLPPGLTLGATTGLISGSPSAAGAYPFTVLATDSIGQTGAKAYSIAVAEELTITPATLPNGAVGAAYNQTLTAAPATGQVTWDTSTGTLPTGLTLGPTTGTISGTPSAPGTFSFTVVATDTQGATGSHAYSITVGGTLTITPATIPNGTVGVAYSQTLSAGVVGGGPASEGTTWSVTAGSLPPGLTLGASTGIISGTPTTPGTTSFTIQATDSLNQTGSRAYSLTVLNILGITPSILPSGTIGMVYNQTLTATGETGNVTWAVATGALPPGLTLGTSTGVIGGTPTAFGTFVFTVQATDSLTQTGTRSYSITVSSILNIMPATVANGTVGATYTQTLTVTNGTGTVSWLITAGALPTGLSLGTGTGVISGTPSAAGTFSFTIQATDSLAQTGTRAYSPTIAGVLTIAPTTVPNGSVGRSYSQTLTATGGTSSLAWSINTGTLPPGLTLGATTGLISGTPSAAGTYPFTVLATDSIGQTGAKAYSIGVAEELTITPATLPDGALGGAYNQTLTAAPATGQVTWDTSTGTLPTGLTLGPTTGTISGTPTAVGTFSFTVVATDAQGSTGSHAYSITVGGTLTITPATIPNGTVGVAYSQTLTAGIVGSAPATGGTTWSVTAGSLPPGLTLGAVNGQISGTPTTVGSYTFTVAATLLSQTGSRAYTMDVVAGSEITPATLLEREAGTPYSQALTVTGAFGPILFSITNGALPAGLTLSSGGLISGTLTAPGTAVFTVQAQNAQGQTVQRTYTLVITAPLVIAPAILPDGLVGAAYGQTLTVTGTTQPFTWAVNSGTLPPGLTLGASSGVLGGTPALAGIYSFTVLATDSQGRLARASYTISVLDPFLITTASLPEGTEKESYTATLTSNSTAPSGVVWSITAGALPPGLTLASATGVISGTTALHGTYSFTVLAANSRGQQASKALTILVVEALVITSQTLGEAVQGRPYTTVLRAAGGRAPYVWSLVGSVLPAGLSLNPSTGVISGTTSLPEGGFPQILVVTDSRGRVARKTLSLSVALPPPPPLSISPSSLPNGRVGQFYSASFTASGGTPGYSFTVAQGGAPTGLSFTGGTISGTPAAEGTFRFTVNAIDAAGRVAGNSYTVVIEPAPVPLEVTPASIAPTAPVGQPLSLQFGATGGKAPYTFTFGGNTPPGMGSNSAGLLSGTPSQSGSFTFTVEATDSLQAKASRSYSLTVTGNLTITTQPPLAEGTVGKPYAVTFGVAGGRAPYTWTLTGSAPAGLAFDGATGTLAGTPTTAGTFPFSLTVQDSQRLTATASFSITIYDPLEITNGPADAPLAPGTAFSFTFATRGGKAPVAFALSGGALAAGLSINSSGTISGTPTTPGTFTFAVQATDALGNTTTRPGTLRVVAALVVTTNSLPSGTVGVAYSAGVAATGGLAPLGAWSVSAGALPAGLSLAADGTISGTPSAGGTASFTVRIADAAGTEATRALTIAIALPPVPPLVITGLPQTLPPGTQTNITISLAQPFPVTVTGTLTLIFEPNAVNNADDPAVQFSSGGRTVTFTIPAGETAGSFPVAPLRLVSGTVAGTIRIQTTTNPASATPVPDSTVPIARTVPVITAGTAQLGTGTFTLLIDGFSNTREISGATFRLTPTAGAPLTTTDIPVAVAAAFTTWYQSTAAAPFGGQFRMTIPFTVTGSLADIESVTVTVSNAVGASQPFIVRLR